jgi:hypothetical protein
MNQVYCQKHLLIANVLLLYFFSGVFCIEANPTTPLELKEAALEQFENHCFDCHDGEAKKGGLNLVSLLGKGNFDGSLMFEHLITAKMPPKNKKQPSLQEKKLMLNWLAQRQAIQHEFLFWKTGLMSVFLRNRILLSLHMSKHGVLPMKNGMKSCLIRDDSKVLGLFSEPTLP